MRDVKKLRYSKDHEWVEVDGDIAAIGVTDFAQSQLGDVVFVEIPEIDAAVNFGDSFSVIESVKAVSDVYSPVSGVVVAVNEALGDAPERINQSPYGDGWIAKIKLSNPAELDDLMDYSAYQQMAAAEAAEGGH